jgi:hypothetical protein
MTDPLIPTAYAILWWVVPILQLGLLVTAIITIVKTPFLSRNERVAWSIVSIVIPVLGPLAWLVSWLTDARKPTGKSMRERA